MVEISAGGIAGPGEKTKKPAMTATRDTATIIPIVIPFSI
jgi:hypothetical protein